MTFHSSPTRTVKIKFRAWENGLVSRSICCVSVRTCADLQIVFKAMCAHAQAATPILGSVESKGIPGTCWNFQRTLYILLGLHTHSFQDTHTLHMFTTHTNQKMFSVVIITHPDKNVEKLLSKYITGGIVKWYSYSEKQIWQFISLSFSVPIFLSLSLSHTKTHTLLYIQKSHF